MTILLEQEGDNDRNIEIEEITSDEFDLKYRANLFETEGFMTNDSLSGTAENNSREVRPTTSAIAFVKRTTINIKSFNGEPENWHKFIDSFECAIDKNDTLTLKTMPDVKDVSGLRKLFDKIDIQVRSLNNLGYKPDR